MMTGWPDAKVTFPVLCLLRLLVLKRDANQFYASQFLVVKDPSGSGPSDNILRLVVDRLALPADGGGYSGKAPLLMALCVVANMFAHADGTEVLTADSVVDQIATFALRELQSPQKEVKTMAAAVVLNLTSALCKKAAAVSGGDEIPDIIVQIVCGVFEDLHTENNGECLTRKLVCVGKMATVYTGLAGMLVALDYLPILDQVQSELESRVFVTGESRQDLHAVLRAMRDLLSH